MGTTEPHGRRVDGHPFFLALLSAALFGAATPISKALLAGLSPFQLAGLLYLGAALSLSPHLLVAGRLRPTWRVDGRNRRRLAGAVLLGGVCGPLALLFGLRVAAAASVSLWLNLELIATAILGHLLFQDHDDGHHVHVHPDLPAPVGHSHAHEHEATRHAHPHWPDLHHRHPHERPGPAATRPPAGGVIEP